MANKSDHILRKLGLLAVILGDILGYSLAGIGLGYLAWTKLKFPAWVMILSSVMGLFFGFYRLYEITKKEL